MSDAYDDIPRREELFDVLLRRNGKHEFTAEPGDYKRVRVLGHDAITATWDDSVVAAAKDGFTVVRAVSPGSLSPEELNARQRAEDPATDRSKV